MYRIKEGQCLVFSACIVCKSSVQHAVCSNSIVQCAVCSILHKSASLLLPLQRSHLPVCEQSQPNIIITTHFQISTLCSVVLLCATMRTESTEYYQNSATFSQVLLNTFPWWGYSWYIFLSAKHMFQRLWNTVITNIFQKNKETFAPTNTTKSHNFCHKL